MWSGIGAGVAGLLAILMLTGKPARAPKVASVLAFVAGSGVAGWLLAAILTAWGWIEGLIGDLVGLSVGALLFVGLMYKFLNEMWPRVGPGQEGRAGIGTALAGFFAPIFAATLGGSVSGFIANTSERMNVALTAWMSSWLV